MLGWVRTKIGDKPAWAIVAAAMLAAAGGAIAQATFGGISSLWNMAFGGNELRFFVRDKDSTQPLTGALIRVVETAKTLDPIVLTQDGRKELVTRNGIASADVRIPPGDYALKAEYVHQGVKYEHFEPLKLVDATSVTIDFSPTAGWYRSESPTRIVATSQSIAAVPTASGTPAWMAIAAREIGQRETPSPETDNPRIVDYLQSVGFDTGGETIPWNSAFVNWAVTRAGVQGTNSGRARSWLAWGRSVTPQPGCVAVFWRGRPDDFTGHVGFYLRQAGDKIEILGGNQNNAVNISQIDSGRLLDCRMPANPG